MCSVKDDSAKPINFKSLEIPHMFFSFLNITLPYFSNSFASNDAFVIMRSNISYLTLKTIQWLAGKP